MNISEYLGINLDYVIKIFEYPRNKKGKRAIIWGN